MAGAGPPGQTGALGKTAPFRVLGYITEGASFFPNAKEYSVGSTATWLPKNISGDTAVAANGAIIECWTSTPTSQDKFWGLQKNGSGEDIYGRISGEGSGHAWGIFELDANEIFEGKIDDLSQDFFLVGYSHPGGEKTTTRAYLSSGDLSDQLGESQSRIDYLLRVSGVAPAVIIGARFRGFGPEVLDRLRDTMAVMRGGKKAVVTLAKVEKTRGGDGFLNRGEVAGDVDGGCVAVGCQHDHHRPRDDQGRVHPSSAHLDHPYPIGTCRRPPTPRRLRPACLSTADRRRAVPHSVENGPSALRGMQCAVVGTGRIVVWSPGAVRGLPVP